jgi:hypothetical protein
VLNPYSASFVALLQGRSAYEAVNLPRSPTGAPVGLAAVGIATAQWVEGGADVPVVAFSADTARLPPGKLGLVVVASRELVERGDSEAQRIIQALLVRVVSESTDAVAFDPVVLVGSR